jgi:hypothetical protein
MPNWLAAPPPPPPPPPPPEIFALLVIDILLFMDTAGPAAPPANPVAGAPQPFVLLAAAPAPALPYIAPLFITRNVEPAGNVTPVANAGVDVEVEYRYTPEFMVIVAARGFTWSHPAATAEALIL